MDIRNIIYFIHPLKKSKCKTKDVGLNQCKYSYMRFHILTDLFIEVGTLELWNILTRTSPVGLKLNHIGSLLRVSVVLNGVWLVEIV